MPRSKFIILFLFLLLGTGNSHGQIAAQVNFDDLTRDYTGANLFPTIITNPPNLEVTLTTKPRNSSETVYSTIPPILDLSYTGNPAAASGNNAVGDMITLAGTNRYVESVDVVLVSFAKAASWPALAAQNAAGYTHPVTIFICKSDGTLITQKTQQMLIPWSPTTLGDGSAYPYGGYAFNARFNFPTGILLDGTVAVFVAYNTGSSGSAPVGTAGPYNELNVALQSRVPTIGTDADPAKMVRYFGTTLYITQAYGVGVAPMFTLRTFPQTPATGLPLNSGTYITTGTISQTGYQGSTTADFTIRPLVATLTFGPLLQSADGTAKTVSVTTSPSSVPYSILYSGRTTPPTAPGSYPFRAVASMANRTGEKTGTLVLLHSFASWIQTYVTAAQLDPSKTGSADDPDGDGMSNLLEYAFDLNPTKAGNDGKGTGLPVIENTSSAFSVTFRKRTSLDLTYQVLTSTTLGDAASWTPLAGSGTVVSSSGSVQNVKMTYTKQPGDSRRFFRVKVTKN